MLLRRGLHSYAPHPSTTCPYHFDTSWHVFSWVMAIPLSVPVCRDFNFILPLSCYLEYGSRPGDRIYGSLTFLDRIVRRARKYTANERVLHPLHSTEAILTLPIPISGGLWVLLSCP